MDTNILDTTGGRPTGLQKSVALLLTLGVDLASSVLQYLGEGDLEKVMLALSEAARLPAYVRREALQEAYALALAGGTGMVSGGIEYTRQLLARAVGPRRGAEILERISAHKQISSFEIIRSADPVQVAKMLEDEHPQTIALVLSYLDSKQAADILTNMAQALQIDVTLRLATMDRVSPQVVEVVERSLKHKLSGVITEADFRATGGVAFLVDMLNQVDRGVQKNIFDALMPTHPKLVEEIRSNMFTFDDLAKLDDRSIQRILAEVNKTDLALALKGAPEILLSKIFNNLSERARQNLQDDIEILGPQLAKNVYEAQRKIVEVVRKLEEAEEIVIYGGGGDFEVIY